VVARQCSRWRCICSKCGIAKSLDDFQVALKNRDGRRNPCTSCRQLPETRQKKSASRKRDKQPTKRKCKNIWEARAISHCKERANKKRVPFDLTEEDLANPTTGELPIFCPIFPHIKLDYQAGRDRRCWASVDRIVPELGYVKSNIGVISFAANIWKSNGSNPAERERIVAIMQGQKKPKPPIPDQPSLFDGL
jgi:hypothetical protein